MSKFLVITHLNMKSLLKKKYLILSLVKIISKIINRNNFKSTAVTILKKMTIKINKCNLPKISRNPIEIFSGHHLQAHKRVKSNKNSQISFNWRKINHKKISIFLILNKSKLKKVFTRINQNKAIFPPQEIFYKVNFNF
jgi:hypothetical protein